MVMTVMAWKGTLRPRSRPPESQTDLIVKTFSASGVRADSAQILEPAGAFARG